METYTEIKPLVNNPYFGEQRRKNLSGLTDTMIDAPIVEHIRLLNELSCCFTLQCCYGHFVYTGQEDIHNLDPLPVTDGPATVEYRIAYVALCIDNGEMGRKLFSGLEEIPAVDPGNIQFCCAEWFWKRQANSYALQVEPDRFKDRDTADLGYAEALKIEDIRNKFFLRLMKVIREQQQNII